MEASGSVKIIEDSREIEEKAKEIEKAALVVNVTLPNMVMNRIHLLLKTSIHPSHHTTHCDVSTV